MWGGDKYPSRILAVKECNKEIIFIENGCMLNTTTLDFKGTNYNNSIPRDPNFFLNLTFSGKPLPQELTIRNNLSKDKTSLNSHLPKSPFVFIPFQVPGDIQITQYSPWIKTMNQLYEEVLNLHNKNKKNKSLLFVFKQHPSYNKNHIFKDLHNKNKNLVFSECKTEDLVKNAELIITINSSVGIESLLFSKKIITLGNAFYNIQGLVWHCQNRLELEKNFENLINNKLNFNPILREKFLDFIYNSYLIKGSWRVFSSNDISVKEERNIEAPNYKVYYQAYMDRINKTDDFSKDIKYKKRNLSKFSLSQNSHE